MMIEIRKAGFTNKGAALMVHAILEKLKHEIPEAEFCMAPANSAQYNDRAKLGLYQKIQFFRKGIQFGKIGEFIPKFVRDRFGMVTNKEIDVVLDAAGFAYSDQWGEQNCSELPISSKEWRNNRTKVILLPQAFGPFENKNNQNYMKNAINNIDLIFARDKISYKYLTELVGEKEKIKLAPDFTNLLDGIVPDYFDMENNKFCIVPNNRMIDRKSKGEADKYVPFLISCTKYLISKGQNPFILVHEGDGDMVLANKINEALDDKIEIIVETNPLKIKGIIGTCEGTLGSRFHGLVSALCQGVPSLATGWSHKYEMLFDDYGFTDGVMEVSIDESYIKQKIDLIVDTNSKKDIQSILQKNSKEQKKLSEDMWHKVVEKIKE